MKNLPIILLTFFLFAVPAFAQTEVETYLEKANQYAKERKFDQSVIELSKAIAIEPNNASLYLRRARYYLFLQKNSELLQDVQKAVSINPTDKKILYNSSGILFENRQFEEALKIANALILLGDVDRSGWSLRASIKTHLEDFAGAYEDVTTAIELFPNDDYFKHNQANLVRLMGNSEKAMEMYNSIIAKYEEKLSKIENEKQKQPIQDSIAMFLFSRAALHFAKFNKDTAQSDLTKAVEYSPIPLSYFRRAIIYKQQKMYEEAIADFTKAIELSKKKDGFVINCLINRGDSYFASKKYDEAIQSYEEVIKLDENQLNEFIQKRIALAKQKMQENK